MRKRTFKRGITGVAAAGLLTGGIGLAVLGSAGPASAAACTQTGTCTMASVTIASQTTITDNTPAITFASPVSLPSPAEPGSAPVSLTVSTNDTLGYQVSVHPNTPNLMGDATGTHLIPVTNLTVTGNTGGTQSFPANGSAITPVDKSSTISGGSGDALSDAYTLTVPNVPADTYRVELDYTVAGN